MDIQKEREEFEKWAFQASGGWASFVKSHGDTYENNKLQFAWKAWQAKSQAVPEGFILVPHDVADRCMSHITLAMCHPNNTNAENDVMQMDLDILESKVEAQEQSHD